jgi:hypothetical protein
MRTRTLVLLAAVLTVVPIGLAGVAQAWRTPEPVSVPPAAARTHTSAAGQALGVLRQWDGRRSAAWAAGDVRRLARLYLPGSRTGRRDGAELRRWVDRGLRVTGLRQQVASLRVDDARSARITATVVERTVDGVAIGRGRRLAVPSSTWATHRIRLAHVAGTWRVDEAWAQPAR